MQGNIKTRSVGLANSKDNSKLASRSCSSLGGENPQVDVIEYAGTTYYQNKRNDLFTPNSGEFDFSSNSVNSDQKQIKRRVENNFKQSYSRVENDFKPFNNRAKDDIKPSSRRVEDNLNQSKRRAFSARPYPLGRDKGDRSPWPYVASDHYAGGASYGSSSDHYPGRASYASSSEHYPGRASYGSSSEHYPGRASYGSSSDHYPDRASFATSSSNSVLKNTRFPSSGRHWLDKTGSSFPVQNCSINRDYSSSAQNWPNRYGSSSPNLIYRNSYQSLDRNWPVRTALKAASGLETDQLSRSARSRTPSWPGGTLADKASSGNLCSVRSHTNLKKDAIPIWNDSIGIDSWPSRLTTRSTAAHDPGFHSSSPYWPGITAPKGGSVAKTARSDFWTSSPTTSIATVTKSSLEMAGMSRSDSHLQKDFKSGWNNSTVVDTKRLDYRGRSDTSWKQSEWPTHVRPLENTTYSRIENNSLVNSVSCPKHYTTSGQAYVPISSGTWHSRRKFSEQTDAVCTKRLDVSFSGDGHREGAGIGVKQTGEGTRGKSAGGEAGIKLANGGTGSKSSVRGTGCNLTNGGPGSKSSVLGSGGKSVIKGTGGTSLVGEIRSTSTVERTGDNPINGGPGCKSVNEGTPGKLTVNGSAIGTYVNRPNFKSRVITNSFINIETIQKPEEGLDTIQKPDEGLDTIQKPDEGVKEAADDKMRDAPSDDDYFNIQRIDNLKVYELKGQEFSLSLTKVLIDLFEPIMNKWQQFVSANEENEGVTEHDDKIVNDTEGPVNRDNIRLESAPNKHNSLFGELDNIQPAFLDSQKSQSDESCIAYEEDDNECNSKTFGVEDPNPMIENISENCDLYEKCYSKATGLRLILVSSSVKNYIFTLGDRGDICRFLSPLVTEIVIIDRIIYNWRSACVLNMGVIVEKGKPQFYEAIQNANSHFSQKGFRFNAMVNSKDVFDHLEKTQITPKVDSNGMYQITIKFNLTQGSKEEMDKNEKDLSKELETTVKCHGVEKISVGAGERILQLGHNKDMLRLSNILTNVFQVSQTKHVWINKAFEEKRKEALPPLLAHQKQDNIVTLSMSDSDDDSVCEGNQDIESSSDCVLKVSMLRETLEEQQNDKAENRSPTILQEWMEEFISNLIDIIVLNVEKGIEIDTLNVDSPTIEASKPSPDSGKSYYDEKDESKHELDELEERLLIFQAIKYEEIDSVENDVNWFGKVIATSRYERDDKCWDVHVDFETKTEMETAYFGLREKYRLVPKLSETDSLSNLSKDQKGIVEKVENLEDTIENTEGIQMGEHDPIF